MGHNGEVATRWIASPLRQAIMLQRGGGNFLTCHCHTLQESSQCYCSVSHRIKNGAEAKKLVRQFNFIYLGK